MSTFKACTVADLRKALEGLPDGARVSYGVSALRGGGEALIVDWREGDTITQRGLPVFERPLNVSDWGMDAPEVKP